MSKITSEEIAYLKQYLKDNPIDHKWDDAMEYLDGGVPRNQLAARRAYEVLREIGELNDTE